VAQVEDPYKMNFLVTWSPRAGIWMAEVDAPSRPGYGLHYTACADLIAAAGAAKRRRLRLVRD